jgi:tRNA modification GTPase
LLAGALAGRVRPILDNVAQILALIEVGIDFSDEDVTFLSQSDVHGHLQAATTAIDNLLGDSSRLESLSHEPTVVLVGHPNAGKSTLLNALAGHERAVVSDIAGTTRDAISAEVALRRGIVRVIDVAGLEPVTSTDGVQRQIDEQMQTTALRTIESADVVVHVDDTLITRSPTLELARDADVRVFSKADLPGVRTIGLKGAISVSAVTGKGMDRLRERLDELCFGNTCERATLALNTRHVAALSDARAALERATAANETSAGAEVIAMELREAMEHLGQVVGSISPDELLGRVFSRFCIGK